MIARPDPISYSGPALNYSDLAGEDDAEIGTSAGIVDDNQRRARYRAAQGVTGVLQEFNEEHNESRKIKILNDFLTDPNRTHVYAAIRPYDPSVARQKRRDNFGLDNPFGGLDQDDPNYDGVIFDTP